MNKPKKFCKRCMAVTTNQDGYCDKCRSLFDKQKAQRDERLPSHKRGYDWQWRQFSKNYLKNHPVCVFCGAPATITDHKIPIEVMKEVWGENVYDESFYQPTCHACNTRKGKNEDIKIKEEWEIQKKTIPER